MLRTILSDDQYTIAREHAVVLHLFGRAVNKSAQLREADAAIRKDQHRTVWAPLEPPVEDLVDTPSIHCTQPNSRWVYPLRSCEGSECFASNSSGASRRRVWWLSC